MVFLVILITAFLLQLVLPWWIMIVISFCTSGLIGKTARVSFWHPFLAIGTLWMAIALFKSLPNHQLLVSRVAEMFGLHQWWWILLITTFLSALTAGVCGYCGYHFRKAVLAKKSAVKA